MAPDRAELHAAERTPDVLACRHVADDAEYWTKLKEKLREEVDEFMEKPDILEVADILEVVEAICDYKKFGADDVQAAKTKKAEERGRFGKRIILEES